MADLETKAMDAKTEMAIADSLDMIRTRNARIERSGTGTDVVDVKLEKAQAERDEAKRRQEEEDEEAARQAFRASTGEMVRRVVVEEDDDATPAAEAKTETPTFARKKKPKKDLAAQLGIKKKAVM